MRSALLSLIVSILLLAPSGCARSGKSEPTVGPGPDISSQYLYQARQYRDQGRYELARQSYAQALATCGSDANLAIIKRELAGTELLIRTMR